MNEDDFLHGERSDATEEDTISSEAVTSPVSTRIHDRVIWSFGGIRESYEGLRSKRTREIRN